MERLIAAQRFDEAEEIADKHPVREQLLTKVAKARAEHGDVAGALGSVERAGAWAWHAWGDILDAIRERHGWRRRWLLPATCRSTFLPKPFVNGCFSCADRDG